MDCRNHVLVGMSALALLCNACSGGDPPGSDAETAEPATVPASPTPGPSTKTVPQPVLDVVQIPANVEDPEEALRQLEVAMASEDREIREAAILAIWEIESDRSNDVLASAAKAEKDTELRSYLMEELLDREAPQAFDTALLYLQDSTPDLREEAAEALESLENSAAAPSLLAALKSEQDEDVRDALISALEELDPSFEAPEE